MSPVDDFEFEPSHQSRPPSSSHAGIIIGIVLAILILGALGVYLYWKRGQHVPKASATSSPAAASSTKAQIPPAQPAPAAQPLPPLDQSDTWARTEVGALSGEPELAEWLAHNRLIRRFTAAVDNVGDGLIPRQQLGFLAPRAPFKVRRDGDHYVADPANYHRFDRLATVIGSIDANSAAAVYQRAKPLLQEAYRQLGYPDRDFDEAVKKAIRTILATPVIQGQPVLVEGVDNYRFADPQLEGLDGVQKLLLRMGPANLEIIDRQARAFAQALGIDAASLPPAATYNVAR